MIKKIFFGILLVFIFTACEKTLTILPRDGLVKNEYWKLKEDVEAVLMGAYQKFAQMDYLLFYYGELRGDLLEQGGNLPNELRDIMNSNIYPWNSYTGWTSFYAIINYCNSVLVYSHQVKELDPTFTQYKMDQYNAEAIFLRSLAYFYLVRIFKDVPYIIYPYDTEAQDFFPSKTEGSVILSAIKLDLEQIIDKIPKEHPTNAETRGRATRGAVNALLADISLWTFNYEDCIKYVEAIEKNELYKLLPGGKWFTLFSEGNTLEGIFEFQFDGSLGQYNHMYSITRQENNYFRVSNFGLEILLPEISKEVIRGFGTVNPINEYIWKYVGIKPDEYSRRSSAEQSDCNWIVYRLADVLLMKAEALSQIGRYDEALAIVNQIRDRAFMGPVSAAQTPQAYEDIILTERAKELAYEGKRWFDLLRMGTRNNYERKSNLIEIVIENVPATQKRVLASKLNDPNGWYLPINDNEIESNVNLVQNPYYQVYE
jgi:hypothetical protein